jgi:hypothetical protein
MSFVLFLNFIYLYKVSAKKLLIAFMLIFLPFVCDYSVHKLKNFKSVYPEMQVIIMDVASMSCLSNSNEVRSQGIQILNSINMTNYSNLEICQDYRINTWQSVAKWEINDPLLGYSKTIDSLPSPHNIFLNPNNLQQNYSEIRNSWISYISLNLRDYAQVKIIQSTQVLTAGDTFGLRIFNNNNFTKHYTDVFFIFYDLSISLHLISPLFSLIIGFVFVYWKFRNNTIEKLIRDKKIVSSFSIILCWLALTTLAFIGDNGRYVYLASFIFYTLTLNHIIKNEISYKISSTKFDRIK